MSDYLKSFSHVNFLKLNLSSTCIGLEYFFLGGGVVFDEVFRWSDWIFSTLWIRKFILKPQHQTPWSSNFKIIVISVKHEILFLQKYFILHFPLIFDFKLNQCLVITHCNHKIKRFLVNRRGLIFPMCSP